MLEQIGLNRKFEKDQITKVLSDIFSGCHIHYLDQKMSYKNTDLDHIQENSIFFTIFKNESEFPIKIEIYGTPSENTVEREQYLSMLISDVLNCKTITNYQNLNIHNGDPFYSIIFDKGHTYLADDSNTIWADGDGGKVKILKEIEFINYDFDTKGNLVYP